MTSLTKAVWGPAVWTTLHAAAATCDRPEDFRKLLAAVVRTLPCPECREEARLYVAARARELASVTDRVSASRFVWAMHNHVNARTGKLQTAAEEVERRYGVRVEAPRRGTSRLYRVL